MSWSEETKSSMLENGVCPECLSTNITTRTNKYDSTIKYADCNDCNSHFGYTLEEENEKTS